MKRFICGLVTAALTVSLLALPAAAQEFTDIQGHWGQTAMEQVAQWGLFTGTGNQQFSPEGTMTRGMFVTVMERAAKLFQTYQAPAAAAAFTDVPVGTWYTEAVAWANENNIVNGVGNNQFAPENPVTREQMCVIMARFLEACTDLDLSAYTQGENAFLDGDAIAGYAVESVNLCVAMGLITGVAVDGGMEFQPALPASRAAVAVVLERMVKLVQPDLPEQPGETEEPGETEDPSLPGGGGGGVLPPETEEPTEEQRAEEAKMAEYLQIMLDGYRGSTYLPTTDKKVQECMAILMGAIRDAMARREEGQFLDRAFVQETYAAEISQFRTAYGNLTEKQDGQIKNVIARLFDNTDQIRCVMSYFGVSVSI